MHKDETKYSTLLEQFAREELTAGVRQLLKEALARGRDGAKLLDAFTFNRFNVVLDFAAEGDRPICPRFSRSILALLDRKWICLSWSTVFVMLADEHD